MDTVVADAFGVDWRYHSFGGLDRRSQWCRQRGVGEFHRLAPCIDSDDDNDYIPQRRLFEIYHHRHAAAAAMWALRPFAWCVQQASRAGRPPWCAQTLKRRATFCDFIVGGICERSRLLVEVCLFRCAWAEWQQQATVVVDARTRYLLQLFIDQHLALLEHATREPATLLARLPALMPDAFDWRGRERFVCVDQLPAFGAAPCFAALWTPQEPDGRQGVFVALVHMLFSKPQVHRCFSRGFVSMLQERAVLYPALWDLYEHALLVTLLGNYEHAWHRPPLRERVMLHRLFVVSRRPPGVSCHATQLLGDDDISKWLAQREPLAYLVAKEMFAAVCQGSVFEPFMLQYARWREVRVNTLAAADALRRRITVAAAAAALGVDGDVRAVLAQLLRPEATSVLMYAHEMTKQLMTRLQPSESFLEILLRLVDEKHSADRMRPSESFLRECVAAPLGGEERVRAIYTIAAAMRYRRRRQVVSHSDTAFMKAAGLSEHALYWVRHLDVVYRTANVVNYALRESVVAFSADIISFHILHLLLHLVFVGEQRRVVPLSRECADAQAIALRRTELRTPQVPIESHLQRTLFCNACERIASSVVSHMYPATEVCTSAHGFEEAVYDIASGRLMCGRRVSGYNGTTLSSSIAHSMRRDRRLIPEVLHHHHDSAGATVLNVPALKIVGGDDDDGDEKEGATTTTTTTVITYTNNNNNNEKKADEDDGNKNTKPWKGTAAVRRKRIARLRKMHLRLYKRGDVVYDAAGRQLLLDPASGEVRTEISDENVEEIFVALFGSDSQRVLRVDADDDDNKDSDDDDDGGDDDDDDDDDDDMTEQTKKGKRFKPTAASADERMAAYITEAGFRARRAQRSGLGGAAHAVVSAKARYCRDQPLAAEVLVGAQMRLGTTLWSLCATCAQPTQLTEASWTTASLSCGFHERHLQHGAPMLSEFSLLRRCVEADALEAARSVAAARAYVRAQHFDCEWCGYDAHHAYMGTARRSGAHIEPRANRSGTGRKSAFQVGARPFYRVSNSFGNGLRRLARYADASGSAPYVARQQELAAANDAAAAVNPRQMQRWIEHVIALRTARSPVGLFVRAKPAIGRLDIEAHTIARTVTWEIARIKRRLRELRRLRRQQQEQEEEEEGEASPAVKRAHLDDGDTVADDDDDDDANSILHHGGGGGNDDDDDAESGETTTVGSFWDELDEEQLRNIRRMQDVALGGGGGGGSGVNDAIAREEEMLLEEEKLVVERACRRLQLSAQERRAGGGNGRAHLQRELSEMRELFGTRQVHAQKNMMEALFANEIFEATDKQCMLYAWEAMVGRQQQPGDAMLFDRARWLFAFACGLSLNALRDDMRLATGVRHANESSSYARVRTLRDSQDIQNAQLDDYMPQRVARVDRCWPGLLGCDGDDDDATCAENVLRRSFEFMQEHERMVYTRGCEVAAATSANRTVFGTGFVPGVHPLRVLHMRMLDVSAALPRMRDVRLCREHHFMVENRQLHHGHALPLWVGDSMVFKKRSRGLWEGDSSAQMDMITEGPVAYGRLFADARVVPARNARRQTRALVKKYPM